MGKKSRSRGAKKAASVVIDSVAPAPVRAAIKGAKKAKEIVDKRRGKKSKKDKDTKKFRKSAKQLLKAHYEKRARRQIRMGMLGQARKTLRHKASVV